MLCEKCHTKEATFHLNTMGEQPPGQCSQPAQPQLNLCKECAEEFCANDPTMRDLRNAAQRSPAEKVSASLTLVGYEMRPEALTTILGIQPSFTDAGHVTVCASVEKRECGLWSYDTAGCVSSSNIGDHIRHLLDLFRPLKSRIELFTPPPNVFVEVKCEPDSIMRPHVAPRIDAVLVAGLAELRAALTVKLINAK